MKHSNIINGKLNAFTLFEVLIAMVISSLVLLSGFYSYSAIQKAFLNYQEHANTLLENKRLTTWLQHDFSKANKVYGFSDKIICYLSEQEVIYNIDYSMIIREVNTIKDTFNLSVDIMEYALKQEKKYSDNELIDELSFQLQLAKQKQVYVFTKQYDAATLINNLTN